ncbi:enoyl-CoA hydratase [Advenella kashmirensis W13003]|uniref:Enoyl-CoA hydratase n=1 Tax=Advenella kashmirensis W13003 TaxID=1424334 RepID=V8QMQ2_9BURK|nr:enoyl-CoA hydratase [Advenella kashmirensis]ETF01256.1 enoyl-CoA hydratase [Advenella kashmirensis W13003]
MKPSSERIRAYKTGAIGWVEFNDPQKHNAISMDMAQAIPDLVKNFEVDEEIRVIVLRGNGDRAFAAGSNISSFEAVRKSPSDNREYHAISERAYDAFYLCAKPTIAMINGYCIGGGLDFAASCDIRLCSDSAVFAIPAGRLGVGYGYEGIIRLNRIVGESKGREIFFTARRYGAQQALQMGLVHEVMPAEELVERTAAYAENISLNAPLTLQAIKKSYLCLEQTARHTDMAAAQALIDVCFDSGDYKEGRLAFAEKRAPVFKGK